MNPSATFTFHRFCGTEVFALQSAEIMTFDLEEEELEPNLSLEFETIGPAVVPDGAKIPEEHAIPEHHAPSGEFSMFIPNLDLDALIGNQLRIPEGTVAGEWLARIYCFEHAAGRNCTLRFLSRDGNQFKIQIDGECDDPVFYDGSKAAATFSIDAVFTLND